MRNARRSIFSFINFEGSEQIMTNKVENLQDGAVMSYTEIGKRLGISRQQAQRHAQRGIKKLKSNPILKGYLDQLPEEVRSWEK